MAAMLILAYRMAFDTIGLCAFSYRYNSFYHEEPHSFAQEMGEVLVEAGRRANRTSVENQLRIFSANHTEQNVKNMWKLCDELVAERKAHPSPDAKDLLNTMLNTQDPVTGDKLSDENIRFNMVTFLVRQSRRLYDEFADCGFRSPVMKLLAVHYLS
jgi:cytochrome P450/NADPH-cytochrome P450 reductase